MAGLGAVLFGGGCLWLLVLLVLFLLGRGPAWYGVLPVVSLLFLIPCVLLWRLGVRHYRSTGS